VAGVGIGKSAQALLMRTRRAPGKPGWAVLGAAPRPAGMPSAAVFLFFLFFIFVFYKNIFSI